MDTLPAPQPPLAAAPHRASELAAPTDDDMPLGWECANPALQIECWGLEGAAALSSKS